jgi:hypothetical protein
MATWHDGKVVWIHPDDIQVDMAPSVEHESDQ